MDQYCVMLCGRQAGVTEGSVDWSPVAAALKLDQAEFDRRVVAAMPLIVRRGLDHAAASRIAQRLQSLQLDARIMPDDSQLAYIRHSRGTAGPVPYSALHDFIVAGDSWRLRGSNEWQPWPGVAEEDAAPTALPDPELVEHKEFTQPIVEPAEGLFSAPRDGASSEPAVESPDESAAWSPAPVEAFPPGHDLADEFTSAAYDSSTPMPPPLPQQSSAQDQPPPSFAAVEAFTPDTEIDTPELEDVLINPSDEDAAGIETDPGDVIDPEATGETPPPRSRAGLLIGLLILAGLAYWAYGHWIADTNDTAPATPKAMVQPAKPVKPAEPANSTSVAASPVASPAAAASSPSTTLSTTEAPVPVGSAPAATSSATTPAISTSSKAPEPATSTPDTPAANGATIPAPPAPITAAPASESAKPKS